jgi:VWFA-related protein
MHKLTMTIILLICVLMADGVPALGQKRSKSAQGVYVVAVKGDCMPNRPVTIINARAVAQTKPDVIELNESKQTILARFSKDDRVKEIVEQEFKKNRAFRIVSSPDEADIVFHVCSSYWEEIGSKILLSGKYILPTHRVAAQALAIPAPIYQPQVQASQKLFDTALWRADTLIPAPMNKKAEKKVKTAKADKKNDKKKNRGRELPPWNSTIQNDSTAKIKFDTDFDTSMLVEASPLELVQRFMKEPVELRKKFAGFPRVGSAGLDFGIQKRLPKLNTSRSGRNDPKGSMSGMPQPGFEMEGGEEESLKIDTAFVVVPVSVMDRDGKFVPDLKEENFQVLEDGVKQQISEFKSTESPFHVVLMMDISASTIFKIEEIQEAALSFVEQLRPQDQVMVIAFDKTIKVASEFTSDRDQLKLAILGTRPGGATRLYDAIDLAITERLSKIEGRKAVVVFTDGVDTASRLVKIEEVIEHVEESGALVYPIRYDTYEDMQLPDAVAAQIQLIAATRSIKNYEFGIKFLIELATRSGGRYFNVASLLSLKQAFTNIAEELRRQYWLSYYPANSAEDGKYRRIRVTVDKPNVAIRARQGYRALCGIGCIPEPDKPPRPVLMNVRP